MITELPRPVTAYLEAEKAKDPDRLARCFHRDAVVRDEGRTHRGIDAIRDWYREANARFTFVVEPLDASVDGDLADVRTRVTGDFPGHVAELRCSFRFDGDRITSLEIGQ